jgi:hypothetical protein
VGFALPLLAITAVDGAASIRALLWSTRLVTGFDSWLVVATKMVSTGLLAFFAIATYAWLKDRTEENQLLYILGGAYVPYVLLNRHAHATSFIMMQMLFFWSFLVARVLTRVWGARSRGLLAAALAAYAAGWAAITYHNLWRDAKPVVLVEDRANAVRMSIGDPEDVARERARRFQSSRSPGAEPPAGSR